MTAPLSTPDRTPTRTTTTRTTTTRTTTTRRGVVGALGASVLLALAACGGPDDAAAGTSATGGTSGGATRSVQTAFGAVDIPTEPRRVIALEGAVGPLLGAGITPLATADGDYEDAFLPQEYEQVSDLPVVLGADGWDYERISSLEPDLMIGFVRGGTTEELSAEATATWEKLNAIAPTVLVRSDGSARTKDATLEMSHVLGDGDDADRAKAAYDAKAAQIRTDYADVLAGNVFAPLDFYEEVTVYSPISWPGDTVVDAGGTLTAVSRDITDENAAFLSAEQLGTVTDATAVLYEQSLDGEPGVGAAEMMALPTWQQLPAVRDGHAYGLRYFFADRYETALVALEDFEEALVAMRG
ncbi:ABC transporter substrate-binding protein [Kineococcus sp. TBRC 1896]|uniref:ABC transporter substrate-binding protein n=1 Tax=Kineococcus mangrovi TaxID=1660183 RepID=A0ABV4I439_9ACTN